MSGLYIHDNPVAVTRIGVEKGSGKASIGAVGETTGCENVQRHERAYFIEYCEVRCMAVE